MEASLRQIIDGYAPDTPLARASTIPAAWYVDPRVLELELRTAFGRSWQAVGRLDQLLKRGDYIACQLAPGEPVVVVRGTDEVLRGFFNVCRHHAAAVATEPDGCADTLRCPYHGWTYSLEGELKGTPDFTGVSDFDRSTSGLIPLDIGVWEKWVFARVENGGPPLDRFLGADLVSQLQQLGLHDLHWMERRRYTLDCNWKVFVDNYLDGGYHVPHLHKALDRMLDYSKYAIENGERHCLQWSPIANGGARHRSDAPPDVDRALYYWIYPNFMINWYGRAMDTNLVIPRAVDKTEVVFDFYFPDVSERSRAANLARIDLSEQIQNEDVAICTSVQAGLRSRAYTAGRLSVRREAGEHLFHRLLCGDLKAGLGIRD